MHRLSEIQIEISGVCNATCSYCTWRQRTVGKQFMERSLALRLAAEARDMGVSTVRWHGVGESLLHKDLVEILQRGEELELNHSLSTNCYNLTGRLAEAISTIEGLGLILAIPWVMPDRFVDRCVRNALDYLYLPWAHHLLHVQMVCQEGAQRHYAQCVETFLPVIEKLPGAYLHLKQPVTWPNDDTPNVGFVDAALKHHPKVIWDGRKTPLSIAAGCDMPERFLMVQADGTCVPCCVGMDEWGLGRIGERTLREVWESIEMEMLRHKWREADDGIPCGRCKKRADCLQACET